MTRLWLMDGGRLHCHEAEIALGGSADAPVAIPVPWFVIEHAGGVVVVDGGMPRACMADAVAHWGPALARQWRPELTEDELCLPALAAAGVAAADVRYVVQTHLHMDHTGALAEIERLPNAEVVVRGAEVEHARQALDDGESGYFSAEIDRPDTRWHTLEGDDCVDLFGDGAVLLWPSPGHSPGHQSVEVALERTGRWLLVGDAAYTRDRWEGRTRPTYVADRENEERSVQRLRERAAATGARVVLGHDPVEWARLRDEGAVHD